MATGLGRALPAGSAQIFSGGGRSVLLRDAMLVHTPRGGEIRVDLGQVNSVRGRRAFVGKTGSVSGFYEESYDLQVLNETTSPILVEVVEKPPTALEWDIVKTTMPCELKGRRLVFRSQLNASSTTHIGYTIRIREPSI